MKTKKVSGHRKCKLCKKMKLYSEFSSGWSYSWAATVWCKTCLGKIGKPVKVEQKFFKKR